MNANYIVIVTKYGDQKSKLFDNKLKALEFAKNEFKYSINAHVVAGTTIDSLTVDKYLYHSGFTKKNDKTI